MLNFKTISKNKKAFTLVEALVALAIFSLLMVVATGTMVNIIAKYNETRAIQRDLENAQFAIGIMSKTLRTSSIISESSNYVEVFDYSQDKCILYRFQSDKLEVASYSGTDPDDCTSSFSGHQPMTTGKISGRFIASATDLDATPPVVGKVSISIDVYPPGTLEDKTLDIVKIQSSVSLRDF